MEQFDYELEQPLPWEKPDEVSEDVVQAELESFAAFAAQIGSG